MTIRSMLLDACAAHPNAVALRFKRDGAWRELTYGGLLDRVRIAAEVYGRLGLQPGDRVAIWLPNCPEWPELYLGAACTGLTVVPVDAKLHEQEAAYVVSDSGSRLLVTSRHVCCDPARVAGDSPCAGNVVLLEPDDGAGAPVLPPVATPYPCLFDAARAAATGDLSCFARRTPSETDVASIIYTSGTTGRQKGAMLTHANFCSNVTACLHAIRIRPDDRFLLVLPLHHAFAFTTNLLIPIAAGAEVAIAESIKAMGQNMAEVSPTLLVGVPLLAERLYRRLLDGIRARPAAALLFRMGLRRPFARAVRKHLGGRLRLLVVGGAPSDPRVLEGLAQLGLTTLEGYGLTETSPVLTLNPEQAPRPGTVGLPLKDTHIRIHEPGADRVGEITVRGPGVMAGYHNDPESTSLVLRNGWLHTGDLGVFDADGYLRITGRSKNLIINREGKNIQPEEVESAIAGSRFVQEVLVLGYSEPGEYGEKVGAIVVPNAEAVAAAAAQAGHPPDEAALHRLMTAEVRGAVSGLATYKHPRRVEVRREEFEKTSTAKIRRFLYRIDAGAGPAGALPRRGGPAGRFPGALLACLLFAQFAASAQEVQREFRIHTLYAAAGSEVVDMIREMAGPEARVAHDARGMRLLVLATPEAHAKIAVRVTPEVSAMVDGAIQRFRYTAASTTVNVRSGETLTIGGTTETREFYRRFLVGADHSGAARHLCISLTPRD